MKKFFARFRCSGRPGSSASAADWLLVYTKALDSRRAIDGSGLHRRNGGWVSSVTADQCDHRIDIGA